MDGALGAVSRGGASADAGVWKGNPGELTRGFGAGAAGGDPSGVPKGKPMAGALGAVSRGGASVDAGVWKGNPGELTRGFGAGAAGGDPSGVPKGKPMEGALGKRSRGGGGGLAEGNGWKGKPNAGGAADGVEIAATGGAGADTCGARGTIAGGVLGKRSRTGGASVGDDGVWKGKTDEDPMAATRSRALDGSSGARATGRKGNADPVCGGVSGISVFPTLVRAGAPAVGGGIGAAEGGSITWACSRFGMGLAWIAVTSSSSARTFFELGVGGRKGNGDASTVGLAWLSSIVPSPAGMDMDGRSRCGGGSAGGAKGNMPGGLDGEGARKGKGGA